MLNRKTDPKSLELLDDAKAAWERLSDAGRADMLAAQRRSWILAEAGFGNDADEAAYAAAVAAGDTETLARLTRESEARQARAAATLDGKPLTP